MGKRSIRVPMKESELTRAGSRWESASKRPGKRDSTGAPSTVDEMVRILSIASSVTELISPMPCPMVKAVNFQEEEVPAAGTDTVPH